MYLKGFFSLKSKKENPTGSNFIYIHKAYMPFSVLLEVLKGKKKKNLHTQPFKVTMFYTPRFKIQEQDYYKKKIDIFFHRTRENVCIHKIKVTLSAYTFLQ